MLMLIFFIFPPCYNTLMLKKILLKTFLLMQ